MANQEEEAKDVFRVSGSSSSWSRFPVSTLKLAVEIFDGTGHFGMWQVARRGLRLSFSAGS